jgi:heavy metal translocating P-type ATPase
VAAYSPRPLPLCAHCGLPLVRWRQAADDAGPSAAASAPSDHYCCTGCALAHRLTGGDAGHGRATGLLMAVGIGAFLAMNVMMLSFVLYSGSAETDRAAGEGWVRWALLALATPAALLLGAPFLSRGLAGLRDRRLDTDTLIVLGVGAAYVLSARSVVLGHGPLFLDTAMGILLFVTIGRYLEAAARARTTDALASLARQMPDSACRLDADGGESRVEISALAPGDRVRVRPGERIPVDGVVAFGEASVSQAEITGEPAPVTCGPGSTVAAGTLDLDGNLVVRVERTGAATTLARIVRLVEEARAGGYPLAPLVDRLTRVFVPLVCVVAIATFAGWTLAVDANAGLMNALAVLLIACPCAIGIAVPLASTAAAGAAARAGVLVRSGAVFERLAASRRVFVDKTGTLSLGSFAVTEVRPAAGVDPDFVLAVAGLLAAGSEHPLSRALAAAATRLPAGLLGPTAVGGFRGLSGRGVTATVELEGRARQATLGSAAFVGAAVGGDLPTDDGPTSVVHLALDGVWQGALLLRDQPRPSAATAIGGLAAQGLAVEILSGDAPGAVAAFVDDLPTVVASGGLLPEAKLERIRQSVAAGEQPVMVGDGVNDAPALSAAAVGVTLESGTDLAREVADVTILGGDLRRLPWLVALARRTLRTARINLFWAFFYNLIGLALAVAGLLHPLFGAVAMVLSSLLVVLHSQRLTREAPVK